MLLSIFLKVTESYILTALVSKLIQLERTCKLQIFNWYKYFQNILSFPTFNTHFKTKSSCVLPYTFLTMQE